MQENNEKTTEAQKVAEQLPQTLPQPFAENVQSVEAQPIVKKKGKHRLTGKEGNKFTSTNQPTPEAKRLGWQELRKQRLLTQGILKLMVDQQGMPTRTFQDYLRSLVTNANLGNAKAIEAVNKILEDDILKIAQVDTQGNDKPNVNFNLVITPPAE